MAQKIISLYIDETSIRLLVAGSKGVNKWGELSLRPGVVKDSVIVGVDDVAAGVRELLKTHKVRAKKLIAGLGGLHCLYRVISLPRLPKSMLAEAVKREAERLIPLPLDQLYISWQVIPSPATSAPGASTEVAVFLAAQPRNAVDALVKALHQAGVHPYLVDLKPLALARVTDKASAIVADVQPTEVDIVVIADRVPQLIRTVPLARETPSWLEKLAVVEEELGRTIKFYNSSHAQNPLSSEVPIFVSGELVKEPGAGLFLTSRFKSSVLPLSSPLKYPAHLDLSRYMVNIGLALKQLTRSKASSSLINLNALPETYRPKGYPLSEIMAVLVIVATVALLVPLVTLVENASANTASLRYQLYTIARVSKEGQAQQKEINELRKKVEEVVTARDARSKALTYFSQLQEKINNDLRTATTAVPRGVRLSNIVHNGDALTLSGVAPNEDLILRYAAALRDSQRFKQVIISSITKDEGRSNFRFALTK